MVLWIPVLDWKFLWFSGPKAIFLSFFFLLAKEFFNLRKVLPSWFPKTKVT